MEHVNNECKTLAGPQGRMIGWSSKRTKAPFWLRIIWAWRVLLGRSING